MEVGDVVDEAAAGAMRRLADHRQGHERLGAVDVGRHRRHDRGSPGSDPLSVCQDLRRPAEWRAHAFEDPSAAGRQRSRLRVETDRPRQARPVTALPPGERSRDPAVDVGTEHPHPAVDRLVCGKARTLLGDDADAMAVGGQGAGRPERPRVVFEGVHGDEADGQASGHRRLTWHPVAGRPGPPRAERGSVDVAPRIIGGLTPPWRDLPARR